MFKKLNPILHAQLRLSIISLLINADSVTFQFLKEQTKATSGNLSIQIKKLESAKYIKVIKSFHENYPQTRCAITKEGKKAFQEYVDALNEYIGNKD